MRRQFRGKFNVVTALGGHEGLRVLKSDGPFAVIVSDFKMPLMNGVEFLEKSREISPDSVRIMLTGYAEHQTAIDAVEKGHVFHFLTKPCDAETLSQALTAAIELHQLGGQLGQMDSFLKKAA
jgi:DNA-binding NtrC family response regulator